MLVAVEMGGGAASWWERWRRAGPSQELLGRETVVSAPAEVRVWVGNTDRASLQSFL